MFDPMDIDAHAQRSCLPVETSIPSDELVLDYGFRQGESRSRRPVLRGNTINFQNIDGPRSLMTAWKKLVATLSSLRREASDFLSRSRPHRGFRELEVEPTEGFDGIQDRFCGAVDSFRDKDLGQIQ